MSDEKLDVVVTLRVVEVINKDLKIEGSKIDKCSLCKDLVYITPETLKSIEAGVYPKTIICKNCFIARSKNDKFFKEIDWIYHRLSNDDLTVLKEFIDRHLKLAREDEKLRGLIKYER